MSRNAGRTAVAACFVILAAFLIASPGRQPDESAKQTMLFAAAFLPIYWIAAALAWSAAKESALDARGQQAWKLIAVAFTIFATANVLFFVQRHITRFPGDQIVILLVLPGLWYIAMFAGLTRLPRPMETRLERMAFWLDIATVLVSGLLILVYVFAYTPGRSSTATPLAAITTIGVPAMNGAVIFVALVVMLRPAHGISREAVGLLAASVAFIVVGDLAFARANETGGHQPRAWYEPLYLLSSFLAAASAQMQRERPGDASARQFDLVSIHSSVLPYFAVLAAVFVVILEVGNLWTSTFGQMVAGALLLTGLVMARQLISRRHVMNLAAAERARVEREAALEQKLHQAQKLESVGLLAGGIAHDFNNILMAIRGTAELAARSPDSVADDMKEIIHAADRGTSLTRQLLAFGRRDAIQVQRFDLREVVHSMDAMLRRLIKSPIDIRVSIPPHAVAVELDRGQVEQVLLNLAINARDAMPGGGTLDIGVDTRTIAASKDGVAPGQYARLTVSDTGHGMPPAVISRMFEPFYTTKPRGQGSGLGLATVYAIVSRAGGTIDVSSEIGRGTTMEVLLPLSRDSTATTDIEALQAAFADRQADIGGSETVLVVDDEAVVRDTVGKFLSRAGYHVITATDATEALEHLGSHEAVHLMLTDLMMPGMSGHALVEHARVLYPGLRIICMSGYAGAEGRPHERPVPSAYFIEKPFTLPALGRLVRSALDAPVV